MSTKIAVFGDMTPRSCKLGTCVQENTLLQIWTQLGGPRTEELWRKRVGGFPEVSRLIVAARMSGHYVAYRPKTFVAWAGVGSLCFYSNVNFSIASSVSYTC